MAVFEIAFGITNGVEGGWQNDPHDTGNASNGLGTYRGVASAKQSTWQGWPIVKAALANMTAQPAYGSKAYYAWVKTLNGVLAANSALQAMVRDFYQVNFWNVNRLDDLASQTVANKVYDCGVNQGTGTAAIILQKCLGTKPDGDIGPVTIAAANKMDGPTLAQTFKVARIAKYKAIVAANPSDARYLDEWISRC
jgi:lysozyme family protein